MTDIQSIQDELEAVKEFSYIRSISDVSKQTQDALFFHFLAELNVEVPSDGLATGIAANETVLISVPTDRSLSKCPIVHVRFDFPDVQHLNIRTIDGVRWKSICLARINPEDWWCGKTLIDLFRHISAWLNDAAANCLVKDDDPFEPLIPDPTQASVELDLKYVRSKCSENGGLWRTFSRLETKHQKISVGSGELQTDVWYQSVEQENGFTFRPNNEASLRELLRNTGFSIERLTYWLNKARKQRRGFKKLLILGIKRPKTVFGRVDSDEWIAFILEQKKGSNECSVSTHHVQAAFSPELARDYSGFGDGDRTKKILLIGVGTLGASLAEMLTRSGHVVLKFIDADTFSSHNLARHTLLQDDIGRNKAEAIKERMDRVFPNHSCVIDHDLSQKDLLKLDESELQKLFSEVDLVIDCSASIAITRLLSSIDSLDKPVISAYQIVNGAATLLFYSPNAFTTPLIGLETYAIVEWRKSNYIRKWLSEPENTSNYGGGCRSISAKIGFSKVMYGASAIADRILAWVASDNFPERGHAELLAIPTDSPSDGLHWQLDGLTFSQGRTGDWRTIVLDSVKSQLSGYAKANPDVETGGILLGQVNRQDHTIVVVDCIECEGQKSATQYLRYPGKIRHQLAKLEKNTSGMIHYVGEWHTHPPSSSTSPSATDRATLDNIALSLIGDRFPALCTISNGKDTNVVVVEAKKQKPMNETRDTRST